MFEQTNETTRSGGYRLDAGALLVLEPAASIVIRARRGVLWVTQTGDCTDYLVSAGQSRAFPPGRRIVIEAIEPASVLIEGAACGRPAGIEAGTPAAHPTSD